MSKVIKIKKGLDIPLVGAADATSVATPDVSLFAIAPDDFPGLKWKAAVKPGDAVSVGSALLFAKEDENIKLVAPVAGTVVEIRRGERRKIEFVSINSGKVADPEASVPCNPDSSSADSIVLSLKSSGLFAFIRQRPFDTVPFTDTLPRDIFVTAFDSAPLAENIVYPDMKDMLEKGLEILSRVTNGKVYLSIPVGSGISSKAAEVYEFEGPHPAGNVGVQIANIKPVNKGDIVWTLDAATAYRIGRFFSDKVLDFTTHVALTGSEVHHPGILRTRIGASLAQLLNGRLKTDDVKKRIISGNVLTGKTESAVDGFLRFPYRQITVIPEGDTADEFMGWASLNPSKYSVKRSFPTFLHGLKKPFNFDARIMGGHRAMILSNEYDDVFPLDIYPEFLIKAILAKDIEKMEQLGIYEVAPEDFALPEFVDSSKIELQKIVRDGLDYLRQETI